MSPVHWMVTGGLATFSVIGAAQILAGWFAVRRFARQTTDPGDAFGPITVLKPLHGNEPLLADALTTLCEQHYPAGFQIVCGVNEGDDTAIPVVRALQEKYPDHEIVLVVDPTTHGANPKVGNLINMLPASRHDILVIANSDVHARPDYLLHLAAALARPGAGLVTTLYTGLPAARCLASLLGVTRITHGFLPGAVLGRALGRHDCLGATMCLTRQTLQRVGGLTALRDHLADDNVLGRRVSAEGLDVVVAHTIVATTVPEQRLLPLWRHELRWDRTIRALEPAAFAASVLQYPLYWALLTVIASGFAMWAWLLFACAWSIRACAVVGIDRALAEKLEGLAFRSPVWLLPVRDLLSVCEWIVSHAGRRVDWRGLALEADTPTRLTPRGSAPEGFSEGSNAR